MNTRVCHLGLYLLKFKRAIFFCIATFIVKCLKFIFVFKEVGTKLTLFVQEIVSLVYQIQGLITFLSDVGARKIVALAETNGGNVFKSVATRTVKSHAFV